MQTKLFFSLALLAVASASLYANQKYITVNHDGSVCQIVSENGMKIDLIKNKHVGAQGLKTFDIVLQGPGFYKTFHINNQIGGDVLCDLCVRYQGVVDDLTFENILYKLEEYVQQGDLHPKVFYMFKCLHNKQACEHLINDEVNGDDYYFGLYGKTFQGPYTGYYGKKFYEHKYGLFGDNFYGKQYYPYNMNNMFFKTRMPYGMNKYENEVEYEQEKEIEQELENRMTTNYYGQRFPYFQGQISKYAPYFEKTIAFNKNYEGDCQKCWAIGDVNAFTGKYGPCVCNTEYNLDNMFYKNRMPYGERYYGMNKFGLENFREKEIAQEVEFEQEKEVEQQLENQMSTHFYGQRFPYFQGQTTKYFGQRFPSFQKTLGFNKYWTPRYHGMTKYGLENTMERKMEQEVEYEQEREIEQEIGNGLTAKYYGNGFPYFQGQFSGNYGQRFPYFQKSLSFNKFWAPRTSGINQGLFGNYFGRYHY